MKKEIKCPSGQHIRLDGKEPKCNCYKENWRKQLKDEFGIHFKDSPGELQFLEAFIEDLLTKTHRHKFKTIQGTNYYIKRCEICGTIYADKKTTASKPSRPSLVRSDI